MSAVVDMKPPVIAIIRGLNRSDRTPTTGPNMPVEPYAREPTQANKKKMQNRNQSPCNNEEG